jgi:hypothetical protein
MMARMALQRSNAGTVHFFKRRLKAVRNYLQQRSQ